jgi:soluble lytic murein transglycosylase-like protein
MTTEQRTPQHRKPSPATKIRVVALRAAAIGAVAVPAAALSAHEFAGEQSAANPMQPADDSTLTQHSAHPAHPATQDPYSPADVQGTLMSLGQEHMLAIEHASATAVAEAKSAAAAVPANKRPTASTTPAAAPKSAEYTVQQGDSLSEIAERTLGSAGDYTEIYALNKDRAEPGGGHLTDPSLIQPGWTLTLPAGADTSHAASSSGTGATAASYTVSTKPAPSTRSTSSSRSHSSNSSGSHSSSSSSGSSKSSSSSSSTSSSTHHSSSSNQGSGDTHATGSLNTWIDDAVSVLGEHGYDVSYNAVYETVMHESGGNPDAENGSDSNAAEGHPSIGLMQTIQSTFDEYALPGYDDIYNPVDNIIAGARYAAAVYGSLDEMVAARCDGSCWRGY